MTATINRKTRKGELETGTDGSSQTLQNPRADGYGYGFGPPRSSASGFWMGLEPNRTVFPVQTRTAGRLPRPIANTIWEPWLAVVDTWGRWSWEEVGRAEVYIVSYQSKWDEWQPTCMFDSSWILLRIAAGESTGRAISVSRSDVVCWFTATYRDEWVLISRVWEIQKGHPSTERTSGDVCLKTLLGSYMNHTLTIKL